MGLLDDPDSLDGSDNCRLGRREGLGHASAGQSVDGRVALPAGAMAWWREEGPGNRAPVGSWR
eukprot:365154-Chlamydomonas_euryale.AAC.6